MIPNSLNEFLSQRVDADSNEGVVLSYTNEVVSIGSGNANGKEGLSLLLTDELIINFRYYKAKSITNFPDLIRFNRCPHVTLLCKGGFLIAKEGLEENGFTPSTSIYFWSVAFTGENFNSVGLHQWKAWSWGIPKEKDVIALDRWNIPGEIAKENARIKSLVSVIVDALKNTLN